MSASSLPNEVSLPSLPTDTKSAAANNKKENASTSFTPGAASISSDLSTTSAAAVMGAVEDPNNDQARWYYYLSPRAAKRLRQYQYHGSDLSLLYKHVLSPLAAWCVDNLTPVWLAPNVITLLGLAWMVLSYCVVWYYCPGMHEANANLSEDNAVPCVIFLLNGCAMVIYQTLDNMDGKQARKTGSSSSLGLLFDHGCDAMNSILGSANWIAAMAMVPGDVGDLLGNSGHNNVQSKSLLSQFFGGDAILASLLIFCPMIAFYVTTWEQYHTGKLILPPFNGPSEGLVMGASLSIISFLWGPMYWQSTSLTDGAIEHLESFMGDEETLCDNFFFAMQGQVRNMDLIVFASVVALFQEIIQKMLFVARTYGLQSLWTLVPNLLLVASTFAMLHLDRMLFLRSPRTMLHLLSGLFTEQTTQLMLDHMVEEQFEVCKRWSLFPLVLLAAAMVMGMPISAGTLDAILLAYSSGLWVYIAFKIRIHLYEICDVLGIWCFDIVNPYPQKLTTGGELACDALPTADGTEKKIN